MSRATKLDRNGCRYMEVFLCFGAIAISTALSSVVEG